MIYKRVSLLVVFALALAALLAILSMAASAAPRHARPSPPGTSERGEIDAIGAASEIENERLDHHLGPSWRGNPRVAVDGLGQVYAFWDDQRRWPQRSIYWNVRTTGWQTETLYLLGNNVTIGPIGADAAGNLYITYRDSTGVPHFRKRPADGEWEAAQEIPQTLMPADLAVSDGGTVHLLSGPDLNGDIHVMTRATDGTWSELERVNPDHAAILGVPARLAVAPDGELAVTWGHRDGDGLASVYLGRRPGSGQGWEAAQQVDVAQQDYELVGLDLDADAEYVHLLWTACTGADACRAVYNQCDADGCTAGQTVASTGGDDTFDRPYVVATPDTDGSEVYALFWGHSTDTGFQKLYLTRRAAGGAWNGLVELFTTEGSVSQPDLAHGNGYLAAVWNGWLGPDDGHAIWNHTWQQGFLPGQLADLTLTAADVQFGQLYEQSGRFYLPLTIDVHNAGNGAVYDGRLRLRHGLPGQAAPVITDITGLAVAAGGHTAVNYDWDVTDVMGRLDLVVTLDPDDALGEKLENNNQAVVSTLADANPQIIQVKSSFKPGTFLRGVPLNNTFFVRVDWNGDLPGLGAPDHITFDLNGSQVDVPVADAGAWVEQTYDMGALNPGSNILRLNATSADSRVSRLTLVELRGMAAPAWLTGSTAVTAEPPAALYDKVAVYEVDATWPAAPIDATFDVPAAAVPVMPGLFGPVLQPWSLMLTFRSQGRLGNLGGQGKLAGYLAGQPLLAEERGRLTVEGSVGGDTRDTLALETLTGTLSAGNGLRTTRLPIISPTLPILAQSALSLSVEAELALLERADGQLGWFTQTLDMAADVEGVLSAGGERNTHLDGGIGGQPWHRLSLTPGDVYTKNYAAHLYAWGRERFLVWDKTWQMSYTATPTSTQPTGTLRLTGPTLSAHSAAPQEPAPQAADALAAGTYPYADLALAYRDDDDMTLVNLWRVAGTDLNLEAFRWNGTEWTYAGKVTNDDHINAQPAIAYAGDTPLLLWTRVQQVVNDSAVTPPRDVLPGMEIVSILFVEQQSPPVAGFVSSSPNIFGQTTVFTNTTLPGVPSTTSYAWDLGDGAGSSSLKNPTYQYPVTGTFTVILTATNLTGSDVVTGNVVVCQPPAGASFTYTPTATIVNQPITFTGSVTGGDPPLNYAWSFDDGSSGNGQVVTHSYNVTDTFTVVMTVTNSCGSDAASDVLTVTDPPRAPTAGFESSSPDTWLEATVFTNTTLPGFPPPVQYEWDFGDGSPRTAQMHPTHQYTQANTYTVSLIASNPTGNDIAFQDIFIQNPTPPVASFQSTSPDYLGETTGFSNNSQHATGHTWDFGDGSPHSTLQDPTHVYTATGSFTVILTATNAYTSDVASDSVLIQCRAPGGADLNWTPADPVSGQPITFTGSVATGSPTLGYAWDLGDSSSASGQTVTHTYAAPDVYTVTLTVTNTCGPGSDSVSRTITVTSPLARHSSAAGPDAPLAPAAWLTPTTLTDNGVMDFLPAARADVAGSETVMAMWLRDDDNDYPLFLDETTRTLTVDMIAAWWDGITWTLPSLAVADVNVRQAPQFAYRQEEAVVVWSHDADANPATLEDTAIHYAAWISPTWTGAAPLPGGDGAGLADLSPRVVFDRQGQATAVWVRVNPGGPDELYYATYISTTGWIGPHKALEAPGIENLGLLIDAQDNPVALWQALSENGQDLWYTVFDQQEGVWGIPQPLTSDSAVEGDYGATVNGAGEVIVLYVRRAVNRSSETVGGQLTFYPTLDGQTDSADLVQVTSEAATTLDLTVDALEVSPPNPIPGEGAVVSATLVNNGNLTANPARLAFYDGATPIGGTQSTILAAGDRETFSVEWSVPQNGQVHTLQAVADPGGALAEIDETNNVITLTTVLPDLRLFWQATDFSTDTISVTLAIGNAGVSAAPAPFVVELWPKSYSSSPYASAIVDTDLPAGGVLEITFTFRDVSVLPSDAIVSYAVMDASDTVVEGDEENNVELVDVPRRPDLFIGPYDLTGAPTQRLTVHNRGPVAANDVRVRVYRGALGGDPLFETGIDSLSPGEQADLPLWGTTGELILSVRLDPQNGTTEGDESNNLAEQRLTLWPRLYLPLTFKNH